MSILIIGAKGNMGRRYASILTYLGKEWVGVDAENESWEIREKASHSDGVVIATPTDTHAALIRLCVDFKKPILCEKPITKNVSELRELTRELKAKSTSLTMVYQYRELVNPFAIGWTYYNNWNHGKDGLAWDCIQIIGLARSSVALQEDSPIWKCHINGHRIQIGDMDKAYVSMMDRWLKKPGQDLGEIREIHEKVEAFDKESKRASD